MTNPDHDLRLEYYLAAEVGDDPLRATLHLGASLRSCAVGTMMRARRGGAAVARSRGLG